MPEAIRIREAEPVAYDSYKAAIRLVTDWQFLVELTEQIMADTRLSLSQLDGLLAFLESREAWLRGNVGMKA